MANKTMHHVIIGDDTYEIVDQYAREHGAEIDATLTQTGKAADAKAVGDALQNVSGVPSSVRTAMLTLFQKAAYIEEGVDDEIAIIQSWASAVTAITLSASAISINGATASQLIATTNPAGGIVTWESSDLAVATVSSTGLVTGVGNGTCTITARSGDVSATCTATVTGFATLTGIDAVYTQSGTVYDTASLNSLRSDLVVTASYDNSTTAVITDYVLSGTLTAGTSTITVSYGGFTDTFIVVVVPAGITLYDYVTGTASGSSTNRVVKTDIVLNPSGCAYDVELRFKPLSTMPDSSGGQPILGCRNTASTTTTDAFAFYSTKSIIGYHIFGEDTSQTIPVIADAINTLSWNFVDGATSTLTLNGTDYSFGPMSASSMTVSKQPLYLFGTNKGGTVATGSNTHCLQVGEIKIKNQSGVLLYDFKPGYNSTTSKYGFYEAVNGNFYYANSVLTAGNWS